jgi:hypothetical protein
MQLFTSACVRSCSIDIAKCPVISRAVDLAVSRRLSVAVCCCAGLCQGRELFLRCKVLFPDLLNATVLQVRFFKMKFPYVDADSRSFTGFLSLDLFV